MFVTFWPAGVDFQNGGMSENARFYARKMQQLRVARFAYRPLSKQLEDLLDVVRDCEARWALEDRIDRQLGRS